ncbi:30S ribosomal protein S5 [Candidatus Nomurabacteria bacterium]|nr:30S ribosomal protein S5 [Candidatus Nomurabacteria bacterium]USN94788.1 MAG: 30S ribosomal protein S5 [Candidatus Nomurabacteria bacterium]
MTEDTTKKENIETVSTAKPAADSKDTKRAPFDGKRSPRRPFSPRGKRRDDFKSDFEQKILDIRRVTRVVAGGRRFSFAIVMAVGDKKGSIGVGTGKSIDTALAIEKALRKAKKNMVTLKLRKDGSIPFELKAKYKSSSVILFPNAGKGLVAGSSVRDILALAGVKNTTSKIHSGSKNKLNNAKAAIKALEPISTRYKAPEKKEAPKDAPQKEEKK